MKEIANKTQSKKRGNPKWRKGGVSPNPKGRPKDGESWASIIKSVGDMYATDILAFVGDDNPIATIIKRLPKDVQMKYLVVTRVFAQLLVDPNSGLWKELMERAEGKVQNQIDLTTKGNSLLPETLKPSEIAERAALLTKHLKSNE